MLKENRPTLAQRGRKKTKKEDENIQTINTIAYKKCFQTNKRTALSALCGAHFAPSTEQRDVQQFIWAPSSMID